MIPIVAEGPLGAVRRRNSLAFSSICPESLFGGEGDEEKEEEEDDEEERRLSGDGTG